jgi:DNA-binding NtrC family response regulator
MSGVKTPHPTDAVSGGRSHNGAMDGIRLPKDAHASVGMPPHAGDLDVHAIDGRVRVLVVDDDVRVRSALVETFAIESDLVVIGEAATAGTAITLAKGADPCVAVVDTLLPDATTGLALVRHLAERPGWAVVAMSVGGGLRPAALAAGAAAFVEKDGDIDALLHAVRTATH